MTNPRWLSVDSMAAYTANRNKVDTLVEISPIQLPAGSYYQYEIESAKLEERISAMKALSKDKQPFNLLEGMLMLDCGPIIFKGGAVG